MYAYTSFVLGALSVGCFFGGLILGGSARTVLSCTTLTINLCINTGCIVLYYLFYQTVSSERKSK